MRPTLDRELVFEGMLEARVAAQLLSETGRADLLASVTPPIEPPSIGRFEFVARLGEEQKGNGDATEYICPFPYNLLVVHALAEATGPPRSNRPTLNRKEYMGQKLADFITKAEELPSVKQPLQTIEVGGLTIIGASDEMASLLKRREAFVNQYLSEHGLNASELSVAQILEIREQPGWQNPPEIS